MSSKEIVAYFSMEIGVQSQIPTYSGGLGVLAGDTIRSAADLKLPMVAVSLLHRKGYFRQMLTPDGDQKESAEEWEPKNFFQLIEKKVSVQIEGRTVWIQAWKVSVIGVSGHPISVLFLDTRLPENAPEDQVLTDFLYGGDIRYRLKQEIVLGVGGVRMLRELGYHSLRRFHMNEGHSSLLTLELIDEALKKNGEVNDALLESIRNQCIFTTHTPVPAGHDAYPMEMVRQCFGDHPAFAHPTICCNGTLNLTYLALNLSGYINGVAKKHGEVSRKMFAGYTIDDITNGVHASSWASPPFHELFNRYIPGWKEDNFSLRYALRIPNNELWGAHQKSKKQLFERIAQTQSVSLEPEILTLGFARRATGYKRADLLFHNIERVKQIAAKTPIQVIYAGKAHPHDQSGKELIKKIFHAQKELNGLLTVVYLENYDMNLGQLLTSGVDVWLNNPKPPLEASGTSGMKAALNGVPSLSILDGWWIEGCVEGVTGWAIESSAEWDHNSDANDSASLCDKLEKEVLPSYYHNRNNFIAIMKNAIGINGSFFNTHRMMQEYVLKAYFI